MSDVPIRHSRKMRAIMLQSTRAKTTGAKLSLLGKVGNRQRLSLSLPVMETSYHSVIHSLLKSYLYYAHTITCVLVAGYIESWLY